MYFISFGENLLFWNGVKMRDNSSIVKMMCIAQTQPFGSKVQREMWKFATTEPFTCANCRCDHIPSTSSSIEPTIDIDDCVVVMCLPTMQFLGLFRISRRCVCVCVFPIEMVHVYAFVFVYVKSCVSSIVHPTKLYKSPPPSISFYGMAMETNFITSIKSQMNGTRNANIFVRAIYVCQEGAIEIACTIGITGGYQIKSYQNTNSKRKRKEKSG